MGFIPWGDLLSRQHGSVFRVAPRQCQSSHWYTFLGESIAVLQADEKATVRKMGEVFPLLVDIIQAAGAVGAQIRPCLEEGAGPAGSGDSWTQLLPPTMVCSRDRPPALTYCTDLSPPDTPPRVALKKRDSSVHMPHIPHQTRRKKVGGVGRMSYQKGFIPPMFLSDSHFYVLLYNVGMMWDHDGKEQCLYVMLIKMFWDKAALACFWCFSYILCILFIRI